MIRFGRASAGVRRRTLAVAILALVALARPAAADVPALFRLFLTNGTAVVCLGEYARVGDRVVFTLSLGPKSAPSLMSLPASEVDWTRTDQYAASLRAARYADTRGEADFAALAGDVAAVLNEIALAGSPSRKLALAQDARRRLTAWPLEHYNYRADDVRQIVQLVDEAISELRAEAGERQFDLNLVANVQAPVLMAPLAEPTVAESLATATALADVADDPSERLALLEGLSTALDISAPDLSPAVATYLRAQVRDRLRAERATEAAYAHLASETTSAARVNASRADVRAVERLMGRVEREDRRLGGTRPREVSAILATLRDELDAARRLRLARDRWSLQIGAYRRYRRELRGPLASLDLTGAALDDIKRLAGPDAAELPRLRDRMSDVLRTLDHVVPPPGLGDVHSLFQTAARLAAQAVSTRQTAVGRGTMDLAWQASSAAAGSLMLLDRARQDLERALAPPGPK